MTSFSQGTWTDVLRNVPATAIISSSPDLPKSEPEAFAAALIRPSYKGHDFVIAPTPAVGDIEGAQQL